MPSFVVEAISFELECLVKSVSKKEDSIIAQNWFEPSFQLFWFVAIFHESNDDR